MGRRVKNILKNNLLTMKLGDFTTIVKEMIDDSAATVDQRVIDSVNHLSNIFNIPSSDSSQSTAVGGTTLNKPTYCVKVDQVFIAGEEILPLEKLSDMADVSDLDEQRWYICNDKITFTKAFTAIDSAVIWYKKGFITPAAATDTDAPTRFNELICVGAVVRYYDKLCSMIITNRQKYPDVDPEEIKNLRKDWNDQYNALIKSIKLNGYPL